MDDFKLKVILSILGGIVFSLIFILLAFVVPTKSKKIIISPKSKLEQISHSVNKK